MVRTAARGIRVSAGKSSKKVGGSAPSTSSSSSKSGRSSTKLPSIPHQETPSWQKPITNFFKLNSPVKQPEDKNDEEEREKDNTDEQIEDEIGPSRKKLKFDNDDTIDTEKVDNETVVEGNKENGSKKYDNLAEGAGTSKE